MEKREAYAKGVYTIFAKLRKVRWIGEQVGEYFIERRRLVVLFSLTREGLEKVA